VFFGYENITDDASGILMESMLEGMVECFSANLVKASGNHLTKHQKARRRQAFWFGSAVAVKSEPPFFLA